jgi:hypothetical protein
MAMPLCQSCQSEYELEGLPETELEEELEGEFELEGELSGEQEFEFEAEGEISPIRKIYPDAMMEHLGELAAEAESEDEAAEHFLPLVGMAASKLLPVVARAAAPLVRKALPRMAKAVTRVTPQLTRSIGKIARGLHRRPGTRPLLRAVPTIARRTVHTIARQAARGHHVTPRAAVRTLATHSRRVLGSPRHRAHALHRHRRLERRFHHGWGRGMVRPHWHRRYRLDGRPMATSATVAAPVAGMPAARPSVRYQQGRPSICPPCPVCGTAATQTPVLSAAPAYCRCCGQVLR